MLDIFDHVPKYIRELYETWWKNEVSNWKFFEEDQENIHKLDMGF